MPESFKLLFLLTSVALVGCTVNVADRRISPEAVEKHLEVHRQVLIELATRVKTLEEKEKK